MFTANATESDRKTFDTNEEDWFAERRPNASPSWRPSRPAPSMPPPSLEDSFVDRWFR